MFVLEPPQRKETATYTIFPKAFTEENCKNIMALADEFPAVPAEQASNPEKRKSEIHWLLWEQYSKVDALYQKFGEMITLTNDRYWGFHIAGFLEPLQLTKYQAENGGHYDWHADRCDKGIGMNRKISGTLLLNDDFEGGEFELFDVEPFKLERGDLVLFPSYHVHRVKPVTKGVRWSLVIWVTGSPWV